MIKAIFVDVSGVLIQNQLPNLYQQYENNYGITKKTFRQILHHYALTTKTPTDLPQYLQTLSVNPEVWAEFFKEFRASEAVNLDLVQILNQAKQKGVKIIITSNNVIDLSERLLDLGIAGLPDLIIASGEIGLTKPNPAFWQYAFTAAQKLVPQLSPPDVLVIDDHPDNLASARAEAFQTFLYLGQKEKLDRALTRLFVI